MIMLNVLFYVTRNYLLPNRANNEPLLVGVMPSRFLVMADVSNVEVGRPLVVMMPARFLAKTDMSNAQVRGPLPEDGYSIASLNNWKRYRKYNYYFDNSK